MGAAGAGQGFGNMGTLALLWARRSRAEHSSGGRSSPAQALQEPQEQSPSRAQQKSRMSSTVLATISMTQITCSRAGGGQMVNLQLRTRIMKVRK